MTGRFIGVLLAVGACVVPAGAQSARMLPAWIEVTCPADVVLTIQGHRMRSAGTVRRFVSPPLPVGQVFLYEVRAGRGGKELAVRQVEVEAGRTSYVTIEIEEAVVNFGIDIEQLRKSVRPAPGEAEGREVSAEVRRHDTEEDALPDPNRRRLTVIGPEAERKRALEELSGPLRELAADYVVQDYAPEHWAVAKAGFVTGGKPTIYGQEADGRVLFRQDELGGLRLNLEAVRKPSPDYKPERDPDYRQTPALPAWQEAAPLLSVAAAAWLVWRSRRRNSGQWPVVSGQRKSTSY